MWFILPTFILPSENHSTINVSHFDVILIADIFDVYNIETALPVIDLEAIETHLMAAKEEEQKVRNTITKKTAKKTL